MLINHISSLKIGLFAIQSQASEGINAQGSKFECQLAKIMKLQQQRIILREDFEMGSGISMRLTMAKLSKSQYKIKALIDDKRATMPKPNISGVDVQEGSCNVKYC